MVVAPEDLATLKHFVHPSAGIAGFLSGAEFRPPPLDPKTEAQSLREFKKNGKPKG